MTTPGAAKPRVKWPDACAAGVIVAAVLSLGTPGIGEGGLGWSDAPNHLFDGVFLLEFFKHPPLGNVREWAEQFYLRHPALGILVYYPPGFALVESVVFGLFGVGIVAARATVLAFAVGAGLLMYALGRRWFDRPTGLFAALILATCPHGVLWLNDVMLEWPATFWILSAVYAYERDRATPGGRWSVALAASVVMAFLTKQTAGFILPVLCVHAAVQTRSNPRGYWLRPWRAGALAASALAIGGYLAATWRFTALPAQLLRPAPHVTEFFSWAPDILGWPLVPLALLGWASMIVSPKVGPSRLLLLWFAAWTGFCVAIAAKEPRYLFFAIPPTAIAATRFLIGPMGRLSWKTDAPRLALLSMLVAVQAAWARSHSVGRLPRYDAAVTELALRPDADLVLVDAVRDGQFVFDVYQNRATRERIIPLRASKVLYARAARERYGYQQFVQTEADITALLDRFGVRYIAIESALPKTPYVEADPPPRVMLRSLLSRDPRFKLVKSWPLRCGDPAWDDVELRLYEYPTCPPRNTDILKLSMPSMGREVELRLPKGAPSSARSG